MQKVCRVVLCCSVFLLFLSVVALALDLKMIGSDGKQVASTATCSNGEWSLTPSEPTSVVTGSTTTGSVTKNGRITFSSTPVNPCLADYLKILEANGDNSFGPKTKAAVLDWQAKNVAKVSRIKVAYPCPEVTRTYRDVKLPVGLVTLGGEVIPKDRTVTISVLADISKDETNANSSSTTLPRGTKVTLDGKNVVLNKDLTIPKATATPAIETYKFEISPNDTETDAIDIKVIDVVLTPIPAKEIDTYVFKLTPDIGSLNGAETDSYSTSTSVADTLFRCSGPLHLDSSGSNRYNSTNACK